MAFRPALPLRPASVAGKVPGGRARVRVGSSCPIRLARMPGSTVSPQSRQRTPQIGSLFAEPPVSSRRMATMSPWHREQLTFNLPESRACCANPLLLRQTIRGHLRRSRPSFASRRRGFAQQALYPQSRFQPAFRTSTHSGHTTTRARTCLDRVPLLDERQGFWALPYEITAADRFWRRSGEDTEIGRAGDSSEGAKDRIVSVAQHLMFRLSPYTPGGDLVKRRTETDVRPAVLQSRRSGPLRPRSTVRTHSGSLKK